jgi:hypothetical protein
MMTITLRPSRYSGDMKLKKNNEQKIDHLCLGYLARLTSPYQSPLFEQKLVLILVQESRKCGEKGHEAEMSKGSEISIRARVCWKNLLDSRSTVQSLSIADMYVTGEDNSPVKVRIVPIADVYKQGN